MRGGGIISRKSPALPSVVEDDAQERTVYLERALAVVIDETQMLEFVQQEIHAGARRADHLRERPGWDPRHDADRLVPLPVARQQQQRARQPLLDRVEELTDQVLFDADI